MFRLSKKYRRIYQQLTNFELQRTSPDEKFILSEDILEDLTDKEREHLFLNFYSEHGIRKALEAYGIFKELQKKGFRDFIIKINTRDPYRHILKVYYEKERKDHLLGELYVRKTVFIAKPTFPSQIACENFAMVVIEWLALQNPLAHFSSKRPPLPGQVYPGLGMGREVLALLINMAKRLQTDGLLNIPEHYHNALFYGKFFKYFNPDSEGKFRAIQRDLQKYSIAQAAWAVYLDCLIEKKSGKQWAWFTDEQILPVSEKMCRYYKSEAYEQRVNETMQQYEFTVDHEKYNKLIRKQPIAGFASVLTI